MTLTLLKLRGLYNEAYKILAIERTMRAKVFREGDPRREAKLVEIDRAIDILTLLKDELKPHCTDMEQGELLPLPRKIEYP